MRKKTILSIFLLTILTTTLFGVFVSVSASTLTVGSGKTYATIQSAIDVAIAGDVIEVYTGTYVEDLVIDKTLDLVAVEDDVTIKGVDQLNDAAFWPLADPNIDIQANDVEIHGFNIESPDVTDGFYSSGIVLTGTNIKIYDNAFNSIADGAGFCIVIQTWRAPGYPGSDISGLYIADNTFSGTGLFDSIFLNADVGLGPVTINDNTFTGNAYRAVATQRPNVVIEHNTIDTIYNGIWVDTEDVTIHDNNILTDGYGVKNTGSETLDATSNWWGDLDPSDNVVGDVDFSAWLDEPWDTPPPAPKPKPRRQGIVWYGEGLNMGNMWATPNKLIAVFSIQHETSYSVLVAIQYDTQLNTSVVVFARSFLVRTNCEYLAIYLPASLFPENYEIVIQSELGSLPYVVASNQYGIERNVN